MAKANTTCDVPSCDEFAVSRGWCRSHYNRWYATGFPEPSVPATTSCLRCGGALPPKPKSGPRASYCSRSCRSAVEYSNRRDSIADRRRAARLERVCQWAGCATTLAHGENARANKWCRAHVAEKRRLEPRDNLNVECSEPDCSRPVRAKGVCNMHYKTILRAEGRIKQAAWDDRKRANDQIRRARKKGARVEHVSLEAVAARDDYVCGICLEPVDMGAVWPDPMSKSLDHVLPLSKGGAHSYDNTQLAHLRYNVSKGNRVEGRPETSSVVA